MKKIFFIAAIPFYLFLAFWGSTTAFHKLSEKSDFSVLIGVALISLLLLILLTLLYYAKKIFKN